MSMYGLVGSVCTFVKIRDYEDEIFGNTQDSEGSDELCIVC